MIGCLATSSIRSRPLPDYQPVRGGDLHLLRATDKLIISGKSRYHTLCCVRGCGTQRILGSVV